MMKIFFYPDPNVYKTRVMLAIRAIDEVSIGDIDHFDVAVHWDFQDVNQTPEVMFDWVYDGKLVLNHHLNNVTKQHVDECFTRAFGYSSLISDTYQGQYLSKRNQQSRGAVSVLLPEVSGKKSTNIDKYSPDYRIKQKIIRTDKDSGWCIEYRYMKFGEYSYVIEKQKPPSRRYRSNAKKYRAINIPEAFYEDEHDKIESFCNFIGLDFGEVDVLREAETGALYIVDVNNIAGGAPVFLSLDDGKIMERYVECFKKMIGL